MADFPTHPDDVTPAWLEERLCLGEKTVQAVEWEAIGTGQVGDSVRFRIAYDVAGKGPETLAGKFPAADPASRGTAAAFGLYAKEVNFYREIAGNLPVRTPQVVAAEIGKDPSSFVLIFEDIGPARGGDQIAGCNISDARMAIGQAAALHAPSWRNPEIVAQDWLRPPPDQAQRVKALYPQAQLIFRERYAETLEPEFMAVCERTADLADRIFDRDAKPVSLVHGDFRLDNMLFDIRNGSEPIAILDWQTLTVGNGLTDIGYFLGCGIGDELRRLHEDELLDLYCEEMGRWGIGLTRNDIWDAYRLGALHGVTTAVFSAAFVERTDRGDANFLSMARGACALVDHHGSLDLLEG